MQEIKGSYIEGIGRGQVKNVHLRKLKDYYALLSVSERTNTVQAAQEIVDEAFSDSVSEEDYQNTVA